MGDNTPQVELMIGDNEVVLQGSEEFISNELDTILDNVDFNSLAKSEASNATNGGVEASTADMEGDHTNGSDSTDSKGSTSQESDYHTAIEEVADSLNISPDKVGSHFYIEDENIHIKDVYTIPKKYGFIGYCMLNREMSGETMFDYNETKKKLIDDERLSIEDWGGTFMYNQRQDGIIKDDPNTDKSRNKPFKITPKAEEKFREWLLQNEDS